MEDKKKKKDDKRIKETSQKVPEQNVKVPESTKPSCSQQPTTPTSVSPSPGPVDPSSPNSSATGFSAPVLPGGGNNAKQRTAVANGQPSSLSGNQTPQQQRYMSREVPPRFRCQQDHKVLLKRGQPPLSSMLLGGGGGDESTGGVGVGSGWGAAPPLSSKEADNSNANTDTDSNLGSSSPSPPNTASSSGVTALSLSSSSTNSTYANSTWGAGSVSLPPSQGCDKIIVDGTDLDSWPSIQGTVKLSSDGSGGRVQQQDGPGNKNSSASFHEKNLQQIGGVAEGGAGKVYNPSPPISSPLSSFSSQNECVQTGSVMWSSSTSPRAEAGLGSAAFYNSKVSHLLPGPQESPADSNSSLPGAILNPSVNPSAWPALVQGKTSTSATSLHLSSVPASTTSLPHKHTETAELDTSTEQQHPLGNFEQELDSGEGAQGAGPGPNREDGDKRETESGAEGEGSAHRCGPLSSSSAVSSSLKPLTAVPSAPRTGASQEDHWGGHDTGIHEQDKNPGSFGNQGDNTGWGRESANIETLSQGGWKDRSSAVDCGDTDECVSSNNLAIASATGGCGSNNNNNNSEGGGGSALPGSASPKLAMMENAWDNQKGMESGHVVQQQGQSAGGEGQASSSGDGTKNDGEKGTGNEQKTHGAQSVLALSNQTSDAEVALLGMLNRSDLDPRVLSNTGWGQTQIRQNVAWDLNTTKQVGHRNEKMSSSSTFSSGTMPPNNRSSGFISNSRLNSNDESDNVTSGPASVRDSWDGGGPQVTCGSHMSDGVLHKPKMLDKEDSPGNATRSWGDPPPDNQGKGWGDEHQWGDHRGGNWRDKGEQSSGWPVGPEDKRTGGWKGTERGKVGGWGDWGQGESKPGGGWGDGRFRSANSSDEVSSWGNPDESAPQRGGWGEGDVVKSPHDWGGSQPHAAGPTPNNQVAAMKTPNQHHQSQGHHQPGRTLQGGWDSRPNVGSGGPPSKNQNQGSGWISGPIPQISGDDSVKPSGWDEPSPQCISHKMEIDDGTSAWGDPTNYNGKNVNLWDKNRAPSGESHSQQASALQPSRRHQGLPHRDANAGNTVVGMWGGGTQSLDNGSGAWNQTSDTASGWGDSDDPKMSGWGNLSPNPGKSTKSLETWGGKGDGSVAASRHPSWEEEDDSAVGIWNSTGSQGSSSSFHSGGWSHGGRRGNMKGGSGDSWLNPISRQFSNMGPLGEDPSIEKKMEGDKRGMADYNGDIRRGGRGGGVYRMSNAKDMGPVDMSTYGEKMGSHGMYVGSGGGIHQSRGIHQPGLHPLNPSPGLRAQVPHPFLSAQVPGSMLKQMPSPGGSVLGGVGGVGSVGGAGSVGGGVFPPQISPQQLAVLSNIYPHVQQFHLACQLLLQQQQQQQQQQQFLQNQRKFPQPQPLRQQPDPQQLARIVAILQQQRHQHGGVAAGSSKLSPSHLGGSLSKQPMGDSYPPPGVGGPVSDPHSKMQGVYSGLELGSPMIGGLKDIGGQQSRFKWMMEGHSPAPSPPESTLLKNGSTENWQRTPGSKMGNKTSTSSWPPEFQPGVPWNGMQNSGDPESDPYMTPGSVLGSPGPPNLNDSDHQLLRDNIGPNPALNTSLPSHGAWPYSASDSPLSKAHGTAKYSEYKSSWPPEPIGQSKSWKADRNSSQLPRPPPGLTNQKQGTPSPWGSVGPRVARSWGGGGVKQDSRFGPGTAWSDGVASRGSSWLLLRNLTPQIDGSTLKTICMQHGPLLTFHLGLTQGSALIRYSSRLEAAKAQGALHMCVLGNTTILAEFLSEEEVSHYFAHCQAAGADVTSTGGAASAGTLGSPGTGTVVTPSGASSPRSEGAVASTISGGEGSGSGAESGSVGPSGVMSPGSGWQGLDGTSSCSETSSVQGPGLGIFSQWSTNGAGGVGNVGGVESGRSGLWGGMAAGYHGSSLWGAPQMEERHQMDSPAALLPGDLLGSGADSV
ncbi:trinucleotide repeat-containing gene 6B protein isoform X2 [Hippocampus comes]|uniref:Trinucleotide repeat containing adaptor 6Bb.1 n=1 Tax=Hippocampus comes TaxID=109280 RepID=A0A3Q2Z363_HIPCM|nr:PREDICTED: trinucleotide repeat-containing gene 6B protein-like isoform X1 [Hippocampus comes]XP_019726467.1 PREDICTED: trinucleotide repeat-containing gene 6B protein-like isoform X2 [Hippocampus comes]